MRNLKKFLALVLAMMMALSLMVTVNAAPTSNKEFSDSESVTAAFEEDLLVVNGMGIIQGYEDGSFGPQRTITRGQMAAIIYRIATGDATDSYAHNYVGYNVFTDVKDTDWFAGYIGYCANAGYIQGYGDGRFGPFNEVTGYQALAMILRAMGYNEPGHNFTGSGWETYTSSTATTRGMLVNVNNTNYRNTLRQPAHRELVAELAFQGLTKAMVKYTPAFGYQTTGMEGGLLGSSQNPSLGYLYYGLTSNTGVIVGNEATGEGKGVTKIGFSLNSQRTASEIVGQWDPNTGDTAITEGYINTNQVAFATTIDNDLTIREYDEDGDQTVDAWRSAYVYESDTTNELPGNVTRSFKWDSNLDNFNHAVKVWYDCRSTQNVTVGNRTNGTAQFTTNLDTYAVFDRSTNVAVVSLGTPDRLGQAAADVTTAELGTATTPGNLANAATNDTVADVNNNWKAPGFTLRSWPNATATLADDENRVYWNYSFGPNLPAGFVDSAANADTADAAIVSPVNQNNQTNSWPLYLLISNSANKELDVVIPLDMTFTRITQVNDTTAPLSVGVINGNESPATGSSSNDYFDTDDQVSASASDIEYAELAQENLRNSPDRALNTKVAAIEITGTAGKNALTRVTTTPGDDDFGFAEKILGNSSSSYYYQLTKNSRLETYTVLAINPNNQDLTVVKDGVTSILHQSVFAEATDATFTTNIEGVHMDGTTYNKILEENRTYTFTLDEQGNYIYWETASGTAEFVYGTYMDWATVTASSSFRYPTVYVSETGEVKQVADIRSEDGNEINAEYYAKNDGTGINLPKRDSVGGNDSGFEPGWYTGYAINSAKTALVSIDPFTAAFRTSGNDHETGFFQATNTDFGAGVVVINKTDATIGAKQIPSGIAGIDLFLTNDTQFYLVDGAGTDNQEVTPVKGITDLVGNHTDVVINVDPDGDTVNGVTYSASALTATTQYLKANTNPYEMVYFELDRQDYAQDYLGSAYYIKTVFIPIKAVSHTDGEGDTALHFVGDNTQTNINARGENATEFVFYNNEGEESKLWVEGLITDGTDASAAAIIDQNGDNVFYNLLPTAEKAADGRTIYTIRSVTANSVIGEYFTGSYAAGTDTWTNTTSWNVGSAKATPAMYAATTINNQAAYIYTNGTTPAAGDLFNVKDAKVVNLDTVKYPGIVNTLASLNNAGSLTDNTAVEVSAIRTEVSGRVISLIFVNAAATP